MSISQILIKRYYHHIAKFGKPPNSMAVTQDQIDGLIEEEIKAGCWAIITNPEEIPEKPLFLGVPLCIADVIDYP